MSKLCPHCRLPLRSLGRVITATSNDGLYSAVVGLCRRCAVSDRNLSAPLRGKQVAIERALSDPSKYLCTMYADPGAARLAMAMLGHQDLSSRTLAALGWLGDERAQTNHKSEAPLRLQRIELG